MYNDKLREQLIAFQNGKISLEEALEYLKVLPYEDIGSAVIDFHRSLRTGLPEVIFSQNKNPDQIIGIIQSSLKFNNRVLATRVSPEMAEEILKKLPKAEYDSQSRLVKIRPDEPEIPEITSLYVLVITGGTSDIPVAEEAAQTLEFFNIHVERAYDVGVAGVHRLLDKIELLQNAGAIICIAGMEGALTSVVAGLVSCPVVGVPTSVGYGANFGGLSALLAMLNSCAPGVAVVNIDNGFGAAQFVYSILNLQEGRESK
ncbi:MAG: nickel pincer cofactor biosynthesis protein LarB [Anaerolineales bacterium]